MPLLDRVTICFVKGEAGDNHCAPQGSLRMILLVYCWIQEPVLGGQSPSGATPDWFSITASA